MTHHDPATGMQGPWPYTIYIHDIILIVTILYHLIRYHPYWPSLIIPASQRSHPSHNMYVMHAFTAADSIRHRQVPRITADLNFNTHKAAVPEASLSAEGLSLFS